MSIKDAKDIVSWQIGFEDGILFAMKHLKIGMTQIIPNPVSFECNHQWGMTTQFSKKRCDRCGEIADFTKEDHEAVVRMADSLKNDF